MTSQGTINVFFRIGQLKIHVAIDSNKVALNCKYKLDGPWKWVVPCIPFPTWVWRELVYQSKRWEMVLDCVERQTCLFKILNYKKIRKKDIRMNICINQGAARCKYRIFQVNRYDRWHDSAIESSIRENEIQNILWLFNLKINDKMKVHFDKRFCQDNLLWLFQKHESHFHRFWYFRWHQFDWDPTRLANRNPKILYLGQTIPNILKRNDSRDSGQVWMIV